MNTATEKLDRARHYRYLAAQLSDQSASEAIRSLAERLEAEARAPERAESGQDDTQSKDESGQRPAH
jgi:hypothetical protein